MKKSIVIVVLAAVACLAFLSAPMTADAFQLFRQHQSAGVQSSFPQFNPTWDYSINASAAPAATGGSANAWFPSAPGVAGPAVGMGYQGAYYAPQTGGTAAPYFSGNYR